MTELFLLHVFSVLWFKFNKAFVNTCHNLSAMCSSPGGDVQPRCGVSVPFWLQDAFLPAVWRPTHQTPGRQKEHPTDTCTLRYRRLLVGEPRPRVPAFFCFDSASACATRVQGGRNRHELTRRVLGSADDGPIPGRRVPVYTCSESCKTGVGLCALCTFCMNESVRAQHV